MKTAELSGAALDWAVTSIEHPKALEYGIDDWKERRTYDVKNGEYLYRWHQSWAQGGPIIEREKISLVRCDDDLVRNAEGVLVRVPKWFAEHGGGHSRQSQYESENYPPQFEIEESAGFYGATPLEAAMRCYVASKLGNDVEIPKELL